MLENAWQCSRKTLQRKLCRTEIKQIKIVRILAYREQVQWSGRVLETVFSSILLSPILKLALRRKGVVTIAELEIQRRNTEEKSNALLIENEVLTTRCEELYSKLVECIARNETVPWSESNSHQRQQIQSWSIMLNIDQNVKALWMGISHLPIMTFRNQSTLDSACWMESLNSLLVHHHNTWSTSISAYFSGKPLS